jgi:hypothetical protein
MHLIVGCPLSGCEAFSVDAKLASAVSTFTGSSSGLREICFARNFNFAKWHETKTATGLALNLIQVIYNALAFWLPESTA